MTRVPKEMREWPGHPWGECIKQRKELEPVLQGHAACGEVREEPLGLEWSERAGEEVSPRHLIHYKNVAFTPSATGRSTLAACQEF